MQKNTVNQNQPHTNLHKRVSVPAEMLFTPILEQLSNNYDAKIKVTGNSMWPFMSSLRDFVVLTHCNTGKLRKNDIILYRRANGDYVLHRIIGFKNDTLTLIGDRQTEIEYGIRYDQVLAIVKSVTRKGHNIQCSSLKWRFYSSLWTGLLPLRKPLLYVAGQLIKLRRTIK